MKIRQKYEKILCNVLNIYMCHRQATRGKTAGEKARFRRGGVMSDTPRWHISRSTAGLFVNAFDFCVNCERFDGR